MQKPIRILGTPEDTSQQADWRTFSVPGTAQMVNNTGVHVSCRKGQKRGDDPTPNQDNWSITLLKESAIYLVADGHGPFGHVVSYHVAKALPHHLQESPNWMQP